LIQALLEKGLPISPKSVGAILIEIGPSGASMIGNALEGLDLSKAIQIILIEVLGEFGGLTSVPALIIALGSADIDVQANAIEAISELDPAVGPALARHLTSPVENLSKQQKKNLAEALGKHGSPESIPIIQQAQRTEQDAEIISALSKAVEQISQNPRAGSPVVVVQAPSSAESSPRESNRDTEPAQNVSIHVSATATATATVESDEDKKETKPEEPKEDPAERAKELAEEGRELMDQNRDDEALEKYKQAYALHPIRAYLLIILAFGGEPDSALAAVSDSLATPSPLPEIEVPKELFLSEIYSELEQEEPDVSSFSGALGTRSGTANSSDPVIRDGAQDLYIVRGESGQDFVAAVGRGELTAENLGSTQT